MPAKAPENSIYFSFKAKIYHNKSRLFNYKNTLFQNIFLPNSRKKLRTDLTQSPINSILPKKHRLFQLLINTL